MAGDDSTATVQAIQSLLHDVAQTSVTGFNGRFKKDCTDLSRRIALVSHLLEEIRDFQDDHHMACSSSSFRCFISELTAALEAATKLLQSAGGVDHIISSEIVAVELTSQFRSVTCDLKMALANFPYGDYEISEDVKEQVNLVRHQLIRAAKRYETIKNIHRHEVISKVRDLPNENAIDSVIPDDFLCPISRELFTDPVMVSTGQTYDRSYIQRWINLGNTTCPKTRQQLGNLTLTPNYVLRSLIAQWCTHHNVKSPFLPETIKAIDGKPDLAKNEAQTEFMMLLAFMALGVFLFFLYYSFIRYSLNYIEQ